LNFTKYLIIFTFTILFIPINSLIGQCEFSDIPSGEHCSKAIYLCGSELDNYQGSLRNYLSGPQGWSVMCRPLPGIPGGGAWDNVLWLAFTPCDSTVEILITPTFCTTVTSYSGLQAALYTGCSESSEVDCYNVNNALNPISLRHTGFVPGKVAYIVLDGQAGSVCNFTINVISGIDTTPPNDVNPSILDDGFIVGQNQIACDNSGQAINYSLILPDCQMNHARDCFGQGVSIADSVCYVWHVESLGSGTYSFVDGDSLGTNVKIIFTGSYPDQFRVYVDVNLHPYYGGGCSKAACGLIEDLNVSFTQSTLVDFSESLCPGESIDICGQEITRDTVLICADPLVSCQNIRHTISFKPFIYNDLGTIYRCVGEFFRFQGVDYYDFGNVTIQDENKCDLIHKFTLQPVVLEASINPGLRQLDCNNPQLSLSTSLFGDFPSDTYVEWTDADNLILGNDRSLIVTKAGRYFFTARISNNFVTCSRTAFVDVTENYEKPRVTFTVPTVSCKNLSGVLTSNSLHPLSAIEWTAPFDIRYNTSQIVVDSISAVSGIAYRYKGTRQDNGCILDTLISVSSDFVKPNIKIAGEGELTCVVPFVRLDYNSNLAVESVIWKYLGTNQNPANNFLTQGPAGTYHEARNPGNYDVTVIAARNGCSNGDQKFVHEDRIFPQVELGSDLLWQCNTEKLTLTPLVSRGQLFNYRWYTSNGGALNNYDIPDVELLSVGSYLLQVGNNKNGCLRLDTLNVILNTDIPTEIFVATEGPLCSGESNGSIQILDIQGGSAPITYFLNGVNVNKTFIKNLTSGEYTIKIIDAYECEIEKTFIINEPETLEVELLSDITISFSDSYNIEVITNYDENDISQIIWRNESGKILGYGRTFFFDDVLSQTLEVEVININGCVAKSAINIFVDNEVKFVYSNAFYIGSSNSNNRFVIYKNKVPAKLLNIAIFDRWGNTVYRNENLEFDDSSEMLELDWDGSFRGDYLETGVYIFTAKFKDYFGEIKSLMGDITIIK